MNFEERSRLYPESGTGRACPVTTNLEKTLIFIIVIVVTIGIALTISIVNIKAANDRNEKDLNVLIKNGNSTCATPACVFEASNILKSMDQNVDPCTDFYSFVCGNWIKNTHLVDNVESQFTKLTKSITLRLKDIFEDLQEKTEQPEHKKKAVDFYKACMDEDNKKTLGVEEFLSDLRALGGWPLLEDTEWNPSDFNWEDLMVEFFRKGYLYNSLFSINVDVDIKNTSRSLIEVGQPSLGLGNRKYYVLPMEETIASYKNILFKIAKLLKPDLDGEKTLSAIEDAFKIENALAKLMREINKSFPDQFYHIMNFDDLQKLAPKIPWRKIIQALLPPGTELSKEERIVVTNPTMIKGVNDILAGMDDESGKKSLANYMFYRVAFHSARHLSTDFYALVNSLSMFDIPLQWEFCILVTTELFSHAVAAIYVERYMDNRTKELLDGMVEELKLSITEDIEHAEWLDVATKQYALLKVREMGKVVGYQEEILDDKVMDEFYKNINITNNHFRNVKEVLGFMISQSMKGLRERRIRLRMADVNNLLTANAYYYPTQNSIIIPVGVVQDTVFATNRPNYINYGSLGMLIGHELTHAFDSIGALFNAEGSYQMWWSVETWQKFKERAKCFEEQYNNYYVESADAYINGTLTLSENIADNGGVLTAYHAYNKLLKTIGTEKSLPGLPYNERQMFWISYASVWCKKQTNDSIQSTMKHNFHALSKFRVIGSLSNIREFSEDFNCKLNSTMHPVSTCSLWK